MNTSHAKSGPVHSLFKFGFVSGIVSYALWEFLNVREDFQEDSRVVVMDHSLYEQYIFLPLSAASFGVKVPTRFGNWLEANLLQDKLH